MTSKEVIDAVWQRYDNPSLKIWIEGTDGRQYDMTPFDKMHSMLMVEWIRKIFPKFNATDMAAAAHDWDRAYPNVRIPWVSPDSNYWSYKIAHSLNSARLFYENFRGQVDPALMQDTVYLIQRHEIGGKRQKDGSLIVTPDSSNTFNLEEAADKMMAADSISGFVANLEHSPNLEARGEAYCLKKMDFYYGRAPEEARTIIDQLPLVKMKDIFAKYKQRFDPGETVPDCTAMEALYLQMTA
ncbi:MAG: hypothetical protein KJ601_03115 [Nanoarchaeota archaeon]|nr:hypothetical protein [Nanoarchaeota archaeon]